MTMGVITIPSNISMCITIHNYFTNWSIPFNF